MIKKLHNAWIVLAAIWLTIAPVHAHAAHANRLQAANRSGATLHSRTAAVVRASAAGCLNPYVVRKGDTLAKIARRCGVSVASLKKLNGLSGSTIWVGQALVLRASRGGAPAAGVPNTMPVPTPTIESAVSPW